MRSLAILLLGAALIHSPVVQAQELTQDDIANEIIGRELATKRRGMNVRLTLFTDGTVRVQTPMGSANGAWSFSGNQLCMTIAMRGREQSNCTTYTRVAPGVFSNAQGDTITVQ